MTLPTPEAIDQAARSLGLGATPFELHGGLCGWLAGGGENVIAWPARVLADPAVAAPAPDSPLDELRTTTAAQLEDRGFGFDLLLPEAASGLEDRAQALFEWCRAFLGGFGLAAVGEAALSDDGAEALADLGKLAQASPELGESEEDEDALAEIEEFVRVAVLLLHGDCVLAPRHRKSLN
ncbi:hypothetical protein SAMN05428989_2126 [Pseudoxanthomonas sp. GM95]|uniref:UPF0149 family protein n=1 Tax=Pseudoxanthomonas sp. GM95 TaxID=1881043 RepID=UPI0008D55E7F|nr:UPF0149 family protein [Pseudoxanthomonas sp. GM95]SEL63874.1 hypothetical protein SAMN05428989_2126 [Pseudoxanthomonas sp. GM95]